MKENMLATIKGEFKALQFFEVDIDTMSPTIKRGAVLAIDTSERERTTIVAGELYLIDHGCPGSKLDIAPQIHRLVARGYDIYELQNDNPAFESLRARGAEIVPRIIGRVKYIMQKCYS